MSGVAGDEHAAGAVVPRHRDAQIPEADMLEFAVELEARDLVEQSFEVKVVARRVGGHRRMEKPADLRVDAPEKLPVSVELRVQHAIGG